MATANPFDVLPPTSSTRSARRARRCSATTWPSSCGSTGWPSSIGLASRAKSSSARLSIICAASMPSKRSRLKCWQRKKPTTRSITGQLDRTRLRGLPVAPTGRDGLDRTGAARRLFRDHHPARLRFHPARSPALHSGAETARVHRPVVYGASIHHRNKNKDFSPALAITQTYENVRQVVRGLSELNQNIRRYIERATRGRSPWPNCCNCNSTITRRRWAMPITPSKPPITSRAIAATSSRSCARGSATPSGSTSTAAELAAQGHLTPGAGRAGDSRLPSLHHRSTGKSGSVAGRDRSAARAIPAHFAAPDSLSARQRGWNLQRPIGLSGPAAGRVARRGAVELPEEMPGLQAARRFAAGSKQFLHAAPTPRAVYHSRHCRIGPDARRVCCAAPRHPARCAQAFTPDKVNRYVLSFFNGHAAIHVSDLPPDVLDDLQLADHHHCLWPSSRSQIWRGNSRWPTRRDRPVPDRTVSVRANCIARVTHDGIWITNHDP